MLPRIITRLVGWAVAIFYEVERTGPPVPDGPALVAANHPNALVDPLVLFRTAGRASRPLAKAPLFDQALVGTVLRGLGGLPVYRRQDDAALMHLNDRTFDAAVEALHAGQAVQIYPEGQSHSGPALTPIRTGAARIALLAEERREWALGLRIQPVGLTYTRKHLFRGRVVASFGEPFGVASLRAAYEADPAVAVRDLTERIRVALEALTLNFDHPDDAELVDTAERLYARQKRLVGMRERDAMAARLPRLRRFADGVRWLRATDPARLERLRADVTRYLRLLTLFGASEGDVPARYRPGEVARYAVREALMLVLVLPVGLLGALAWLGPLLVTRRAATIFKPKLDQVASHKIGAALVAFPLWLALLLAAAWVVAGVEGSLATLVAAPVAGLAAVAWRDRQGRVREDVRVFLRTRKLRRGRDRLASQRAALVAEFDRLAHDWSEDRGPRDDDDAETEG